MIDKLRGKLLPWQKVVLGFCAIVLCTWLLHLYTTPEARAWQNDSEALVWGKILRLETGVQNKEELFFLGSYYCDENLIVNQNAFATGVAPDSETYGVYKSQSGAQAIFFFFFAEIFRWIGIDGYHITRLLWILNTSIFVLCFLQLCRWITREWGKFPAVLVLSLLVVSYWLTLSVSNLYWVTWTMLLPMTITACWCSESLDAKSTKYLVFLGVAFLFRFMCGFEFVSTVMLCSEVPVVYSYIRDFSIPEKRRKYFRIAVAVGTIAILMFIFALGIWFVQLYLCDGWHSALGKIFETIAKRTGVFEDRAEIQEIFKESLEINRFQVVAMYLQSEKMWGIFGIKELVLVEVVLKVICCLKNRDSLCSVPQELFVLLFSALAPISWFFLASGHAYIHTHIDHLLWLFPFVPICLAYIGKNVVEIMKSFEVKQRPSLEG